MEGPISVESFENFKGRIETEFKEKGLSEELLSRIKEWRSMRAAELDNLRSVIEEPEVSFMLESAQLFGIVGQFDDSWDCLDGAWEYANQRGSAELKAVVEHWMDIIHEGIE